MKRVEVLKALVEGCSIRSTVRMTGVAKNTVSRLILELGAACTAYQDTALRNLPSKRLQCDEIWSFVGGKDKNIGQQKRDAGLGSISAAVDADSKLIVSRLVGSRDAGTAWEFMQDVASRLRHRVQMATDGHKPYLSAVEDALGAPIDDAVARSFTGQTRYHLVRKFGWRRSRLRLPHPCQRRERRRSAAAV